MAMARQVKCLESGVIYDSLGIAAKRFKLSSASIVKCCNGERETCGKKHWEYVGEKPKELWGGNPPIKKGWKKTEWVLTDKNDYFYDVYEKPSENGKFMNLKIVLQPEFKAEKGNYFVSYNLKTDELKDTTGKDLATMKKYNMPLYYSLFIEVAY